MRRNDRSGKFYNLPEAFAILDYMCGFVGIRNFNGKPVTAEELVPMRESIRHRGPDDSGLYVDPQAQMGFGFRRLSILDLTESGHQPMADESGRFWIVFNGEIYNFKELRESLEKQGCAFKSRTDTEVLLKLYKRQGESCLAELRGMFALAIWDNQEKTLFLARDRLGKKPLYWTLYGGRLIFASEIKAILKDPQIPRQVNEEALYHYLSFFTTPAPLTLFAGIQKLGCGQSMTINANGSIATRQYWDPLSAVNAQVRQKPEAYAEKLLYLLKESIRYRMISDVPFGVFLSGGIDSSANVALMSELTQDPVRTFSVGYQDEPQYSELAWARRIAKRYKTEHHEVILTDQDFVSYLPKLVYHQDEPIADPVCVPVFAVAGLAKKNGVPVCQVGEGSDEIFCGYPAWLEIAKLKTLGSKKMWPWLMRLGLPFLYWTREPLNRGYERLERCRRLAHNEEIFWSGAEGFAENDKKTLLSPRLQKKFKTYSSWEAVRPHYERYQQSSPWQHPIQWMAYADLKMRLPELLLMRVDKMTMAHSVETRAPFLDHRLVEFALSIPPELRIAGGQTKSLLKKSLRRVLPDEIIDRPKQGFAVPVKEWFWKALGQESQKTITRFARQTDYFDAAQLARWAHKKNIYSWQLLNLALWHETWIGK